MPNFDGKKIVNFFLPHLDSGFNFVGDFNQSFFTVQTGFKTLNPQYQPGTRKKNPIPRPCWHIQKLVQEQHWLKNLPHLPCIIFQKFGWPTRPNTQYIDGFALSPVFAGSMMSFTVQSTMPITLTKKETHTWASCLGHGFLQMK